MKVEVHYPGLCKEVTPSGNLRWRVRVDGNKTKKVTIPIGPEHEDFQRHYEAAREGRKLPHLLPSKPSRGTLDEMCERFLDWMGNQVSAGNLSQATLNSRRTGLTQACECLSPKGLRIGSLKADLPREAFARIRDSFGARTGAAETCLKALRALYTWGSDRGYPEDSPVFRVKSDQRPKGGAVPWTEADRRKFLDCHGPGTMARRWLLLAQDTAGRIGDMHTLGPANEVFSNDRLFISWQPGKKGSQPVKVPMSEESMEELAGVAADAPSYLVTDYVRSFASYGSHGNRVRKWVIEAGLYQTIEDDAGKATKKATRSQHGVRKARAQGSC